MRIRVRRGSFADRLLLALGPPERIRLRRIADLNDKIQAWVASDGDIIPGPLRKLLSDLDHTIRNG